MVEHTHIYIIITPLFTPYHVCGGMVKQLVSLSVMTVCLKKFRISDFVRLAPSKHSFKDDGRRILFLCVPDRHKSGSVLEFSSSFLLSVSSTILISLAYSWHMIPPYVLELWASEVDNI